MKALVILNNYKKFDGFIRDIVSDSFLNEAIKELEAYITNYRGTKRRLDNTIITLAVLQEENKSLLKILTNMNEERIEKGNEKQLRDELCE